MLHIDSLEINVSYHLTQPIHTLFFLIFTSGSILDLRHRTGWIIVFLSYRNLP